MSLSQRLREYAHAIQTMGLLQSVHFKIQKLTSAHRRRERMLTLYSKYSRFPLRFRPGSSDIDVFAQIFVDREYRCVDDVVDPGLIIDCGANAGFSSAYFLSRFPNAFVVAIEPDRDNFRLLETNLQPYQGRFKTICSAVWSRPVGLVMSEAKSGDGREWSRTVREAHEGESPTMVAIDIGSILEESGFSRISILKIDVEGAERELFSSNYEEWLAHVDTLVIELHGAECRAALFAAIASSNFAVSRCDELTVCKSPQLVV